MAPSSTTTTSTSSATPDACQADKVEVRLAPEKEVRPAPREGERVVFRSHFLHGFGLPVSAFFRSWLDFYQLQPVTSQIFNLECFTIIS